MKKNFMGKKSLSEGQPQYISPHPRRLHQYPVVAIGPGIVPDDSVID